MIAGSQRSDVRGQQSEVGSRSESEPERSAYVLNIWRCSTLGRRLFLAAGWPILREPGTSSRDAVCNASSAQRKVKRMHSVQRHIRYGWSVQNQPDTRLWLAAIALFGLVGGVGRVAAAEDAQPVAYCFEVALPITDAVEKSVTKRVEQAIARLPKNGPRPIVVFELRPASGTAGEGSSFGDALDLARFISGDRLGQAKVKTVAWLPRTVKGHAVLPVLACEQIIMAREAELGAAGSGERQAIDNALRDEYQHVAGRRQTVRAAVAMGMLDKDLAVYKLTLVQNKEVRYATAEELKKLQEQGLVGTQDTLFQPGDPHLLTGQAMRDAGFATHLADSRRSLAAALSIPAKSLIQDLTPEDGWRALRIDLNGPIHKQSINWTLSSLEENRKRRNFNLLVVCLDTGGGDLNESKRLAEHIAGLNDRV